MGLSETVRWLVINKNHTIAGGKVSSWSLNVESILRSIGCAMLLCVFFSVLANVFSERYASRVINANESSLVTLDYEQFGRQQMPFKLRISVPDAHAGQYRLRIGGDFNKYYDTESISPQPDGIYSRGDDLYLVYNDMKNKGEFSISLYVTPEIPGEMVNFLRLNAGPEIRFLQLIYP